MKRGALRGRRRWCDLVNIADDRGQPVSQVPLPWDAFGTAGADRIPAGTWRAIRRRLPARQRLGPVWFLVPAAAAFIPAAVWMNTSLAQRAYWVLGLPPEAGAAVGTVLAIAPFGLVLWAILCVRHSRGAAQVIDAFCAERRCCSCGYDLAGCREEADGCTVCPECGGAWRMGAS